MNSERRGVIFDKRHLKSLTNGVFEKPLENLKVIDNVEKPRIGDHRVLIKVKVAGINLIDHFVVSGTLPKIEPIPHIPGAESSGIVEQIEQHVDDSQIKK